jgi:hypothetical protein
MALATEPMQPVAHAPLVLGVLRRREVATVIAHRIPPPVHGLACGRGVAARVLAMLDGPHALDSRCDLRCIIELGEFVPPWSIFVHVPLDILHQVTEAFSCVVPRALVLHITERSLNGIGPWTIRWPPQQCKTWVTG